MTRLKYALALSSFGFHVFPVAAGEKTPAIKGWQQAATRDEAAIRRWFTLGDSNIGIYTGKYGDGSDALLVLDIDRRPGKDGFAALVGLELEGLDFPPTYGTATPSGGAHLYFRVANALRQGAGILGPGLDIRSRGGYVLGAGSSIAGLAYRANGISRVASAPEWLVRRLNNPIRRVAGTAPDGRIQIGRASVLDRGRAYLSDHAPLATEGQRNDLGYKTACQLKDMGAERDDCLALLAEHWKCQPPLDPEELARVVDSAYKYGENPIGSAAPEAVFKPIKKDISTSKLGDDALSPLEKLNREYAFVVAGGGAHILWETLDVHGRYRLEHLNMSAFQQKFAAETLQYGTKPQPLTRAWMEWRGRRDYDGLAFLPGKPAPARFFNFWRGFAVEPWPHGETAPVEARWALDAWIEHLHENVCRGIPVLSAWLTGWFAHLIQRPWEKPLVALVLRGGKGVGKNALVECVGRLLAPHFVLTAKRRMLVGTFNGHLENCLLFVLDEAFWSGDKEAEGIIKDLVTGTTHLIEHKGKEPYAIDNRTRIAVLGNEKWLVPASYDERRFATFEVGDGRKQDREFFERMRAGMEAGGDRLLLSYLLAAPVSDVNQAPNTKALLEQKEASLGLTQQWWHECLVAGELLNTGVDGWQDRIATKAVAKAIAEYARSRNIRSRLPTASEIGRELKECAPLMAHRSARLTPGASPVNAYFPPSLEDCRRMWDKFMGQCGEWLAGDAA